jgi:hypothetical protein
LSPRAHSVSDGHRLHEKLRTNKRNQLARIIIYRYFSTATIFGHEKGKDDKSLSTVSFGFIAISEND